MKLECVDGSMLEVDRKDIVNVIAVEGDLFWVFLADGRESILKSFDTTSTKARHCGRAECQNP